jgi:hypothetical protein
MPDWLMKDDFLAQEIFRFALSILTGIILAILVQVVLTRRDRRLQQLERQQIQLRELRREVVDIYESYYRVRKRYTTVRDTLEGKRVRNVHLRGNTSKASEIFDDLIDDCIGLEARYFTMLRQLEVAFPTEWDKTFKRLMSSKVWQVDDVTQNDNTLQFYFGNIRHCIEQYQDIDDDVKEIAKENLHAVLRAFNSCEAKLTGKPNSGHA